MNGVPGEGRHGSRTAAGGRWRWAAAAAGLFVLALGLRALPAPVVFVDGALVPEAGADDFYHLRRIEVGVERFPAVLDFDHYTNHPEGGQIVWPPLWDFTLSAAARAITGSGDRAAMEKVVAWAPPLTGALTVLVVAWLAARIFSPTAGVAAGVMLAMLPVHYLPSRLAKVDHHVAVGLATALLMGAGIRLLKRGPTARGAPFDAVLLGLAIAGLLLVWTGGLLHVAVVQGVAVLSLLLAPDAARARGEARQLAIAHAVAFLALLPFTAGRSWVEWSDVSPLVLSRFHPLYFGAATVCFAALAASWWNRRFASAVARAASALLVAGVGVGVAFLLEPELAEALGFSAGWFENREDFHEHVVELRPLFFATGSFRVDVPVFSFTVFFLLLPIPMLAWAWIAWQRRDPSMALLLGWLVAFVAAAVLQFRFTNSAAIPFAIAAGFVIERMMRGRSAGTRIAVAALVVVACAPTWARFYRDSFATVHDAWRGQEIERSGIDQDNLDVRDAARWLDANTPPAGDFLRPETPARYGVLPPWGFGHALRYWSRRAMMQDNFGVYGGRENYERAEHYFAARDEDAALAELDRARVRYVLSAPMGSGHGGPYEPDMMARRLGMDRGSQRRLDLGGGERRDVGALTRHRLVYERTLRRAAGHDGTTRRINALRIWERVPGALVVGTSAPGTLVSARAELELASGERFRWSHAARADASGRYALRIPYPTEAFPAALRPPPFVELGTARERVRIQIPETAVLAGLEIEGPALGCTEASCLPKEER